MKILDSVVGAVLAISVSIVGWGQQTPANHGSKNVRHMATGASAQQAERLSNLGTAYMNQQAFEKALKYFQEAYTADPNLLSARLNQGIALLNLQNVSAALPVFQEVLHRDPANARAWYNLGLLYKGNGNTAEALQAFRKAATLAPDDPGCQYFLGLTYAQSGDNKRAVEAFQRAIALDPFHASAEFGIARALQKLDKPEEARAHLARFQHLTQTKLGAPITLSYGEQGALSLVTNANSKFRQAPPPIPVKFVDVTRQSGIQGTDQKVSPGSPKQNAAVCVVDLDSGSPPALLFTSHVNSGGVALFRNTGEGKFTDSTKEVGLRKEVPALACASADFDNDGNVDIAIAYPDRVALYKNEGGKFHDITSAAGITATGSVKALLWVDYDHDGDADLYMVRADAGGQLWRNNGNGTFTDVTSEIGLTFEGNGTAALAGDMNNDRAVDIVVTRKSSPALLFNNPREGKWRSSSFLTSATSVASLDYNQDGWMDLAVTTPNAPGLALFRNVDGKSYQPVDLHVKGWRSATAVVAFDYDNDGLIDLLALGESESGASEFKLFRNLGSKGFEDVTTKTGLDHVRLQAGASFSVGDLDGDGDLDIAVVQPDGTPVLLRNDGGNSNQSLRIALKGLADNKSGIGTKVEVFAGDLWQDWEVHTGGGPGQSSTEILAGLGNRKQVDVLRLLWPTGVIQDEIQVPIDKRQQIVEIDRRGSSCPVLFAWNGHHYQFIGDMIGAGVVGHWVGPGQRNIPDPTEYLKVSGNIVKSRNGKLTFRFMEPMEEVVYLDQVRLLAVDHPSQYEVYPNEYFSSNPPFPEFKVISANKQDIRPPASAIDDHGNDVLSRILDRDHDYVAGFKLMTYAGFTEPHFLELDLGSPYDGKTLRLLMHGFIEYFTATSMYAAHQAGLDPVAPYVEAMDARGNWARVVDDMGFPAGLPRTTVVDLSGKLPLGAQRIRIGTNLQIYWDQVLIDRTIATADTKVQEIPLSDAQLKFHGYPRDVERKTNARGDHYYIYEQVSKTGPYARQAGAYTRLGSVNTLLEKADDRFVVFGSGDVIELEFDPAALSSLPKGWVRDYFFFANGYEKDMDFYAADGLTVDPLPFDQMKGYPYEPEDGYLNEPSRLNYVLDYNTRFFSGKAAGLKSSFRFQSRNPPR